MRNEIDSHRLVRLLRSNAPAHAHPAGTDFAERLGGWLNAFDAVGLQAAHQSIRAIRTAAPASASRATAPTRQTLADDVQRVRATLAHAIAQDLPLGTHALLRRGSAKGTAPGVAQASFAPFQQHHAQLQRQMEQAIAALRDHVRQAVATLSPRLRQLAALDAALERMLAPREQLLLPKVGTLLQARFEALRAAHSEELAAAGAPQAVLPHGDDDSWLQAFRHEWRAALLAELDLRLEPVAGLVDALDHE